MKLDSLQKLYVHELKDLHSAENQILDAMPGMIKAVSDDELRDALEAHRKESEKQVQRLEKIFEDLAFRPGGHRCKGMEGLIQEATELIGEIDEPEVRDAALISAAQRIEHYEIAGYGTARAFAEKLGDYKAADQLQKSLDEEGAADQLMQRLALRRVNFKAAVA